MGKEQNVNKSSLTTGQLILQLSNQPWTVQRLMVCAIHLLSDGSFDTNAMRLLSNINLWTVMKNCLHPLRRLRPLRHLEVNALTVEQKRYFVNQLTGNSTTNNTAEQFVVSLNNLSVKQVNKQWPGLINTTTVDVNSTAKIWLDHQNLWDLVSNRSEEPDLVKSSWTVSQVINQNSQAGEVRDSNFLMKAMVIWNLNYSPEDPNAKSELLKVNLWSAVKTHLRGTVEANDLTVEQKCHFEKELTGTSSCASNKGNRSGALCSCSMSTSVECCGICDSIDNSCQKGSGHDIRIYQCWQTAQESLFMLEYRCHLWFFRQKS